VDTSSLSQPRPTPTDAEIAYAAGIFDGEGSISIIPYTRRLRGGKGGYYRLDCVVSMSFFPIPSWLKEHFGGKRYLYVDKGAQPLAHHLPMARWQISGPGAKAFLTLVKPYLQAKRTQADVAIAFQEYLSRRAGGGRPKDFDRTAHVMRLEDYRVALRETRRQSTAAG
jgi:hypothetical protein